MGQVQSHVEHGDQNLFQHTGGVQLARGLEKQAQFFEVGGFLLDLNARDLAKKLARGVGGRMRRVEQHVGRIARAEFQPVAPLQLLALDAFTVHERAMLAPLILDKEIVALLHDLRVIARNARIGDHQVFIHLSAHGEGSAIQNNIFLFAALHKDQRGIHPGAGAVLAMADGIEGHVARTKSLLGASLAARRSTPNPNPTDYSDAAPCGKMRRV